jgi:Ca2+-binding RTX toxin-like protein
MPIKINPIDLPFKPNDFVSDPLIDNRYLPLQPGTTLVYQSLDGSEEVRFEVTYDTRKILGVTCIVVLDQAFVDGVLVEKTYDYFAQDKYGNVWYFGESVKNYEDGMLVNKDGSWLAGVDGAEPGIIMLAAPEAGDTYNQENAPDVALDFATVLDVDANVGVPYGSSKDALQTFDSSHLDPTLLEHKFYIPNVGFVQAVDLESGDIEQLVRIEFDGTAHDDSITGKDGPDVLRGHGGDDTLVGGLGKDILTGGSGLDVFAFNTAAESGVTPETRDVITDFVLHKDKIDLGDIDANTRARGDQGFSFIDTQPFHRAAGELRYQVTESGILLEADRNGDGLADFQITLLGVSTIGVGDFIL